MLNRIQHLDDVLIKKWASAWSSRDLAHLLVLFGDEAVYEDVTFNRHAQGKNDLQKLLAWILHASDTKIEIVDLRSDGNGRKVTWRKRGSRLPMENFPRGKGPFEVPGTSVIECTGDQIHSCRETWNMKDLDFATLDRKSRQTPVMPATSFMPTTRDGKFVILADGTLVPRDRWFGRR